MVGPITASAIVASVGSAREFRNGRQFAAWLGLTPRQSSSGGKMRPGHISKRGDVYLVATTSRSWPLADSISRSAEARQPGFMHKDDRP